MPAVHREVALWLDDVLSDAASVLIFGDETKEFSDQLTKYSTVAPHTNDGVVAWLENEASHTGQKFDCIFLNRAVQPMTEKELNKTLSAALHLLKDDGYLLVREDLTNGKANLAQYTQLFDSFTSGNLGFHMRWTKCLADSIHARQNWNDHCWLLSKQVSKDSAGGPPVSLRSFLDHHQYSNQGILAYEWIFGSGFISPGGGEKNLEFAEMIGLKPGQRVLDIGSGIGGNAFQMARELGLHVTGVDLSSNMVTIATERATLVKDTRVGFMIADATKFQFRANYYDAVYSRDCIIHIPDKLGLFRHLFKCLKPGGKFVFTDYNVGEKEFTPEFKEYLANRQYTLLPIRKYGEALKEAGFVNVEAIDITDDFDRVLRKEMERATTYKQQFLEKFSEDKFEHLIEGWRNKLVYLASGDQKWGLFKATKPQ